MTSIQRSRVTALDLFFILASMLVVSLIVAVFVVRMQAFLSG